MFHRQAKTSTGSSAIFESCAWNKVCSDGVILLMDRYLAEFKSGCGLAGRVRPRVQLTGLLMLLLVCVTVLAAPAPKPVVTADVVARTLSPVNWYTGTIISREHARLAAEGSGRLLWVAEAGTRIEKGEVVARVDGALLKDELAERQADIKSIEARLVFLKQELSRLQRLAKQNNAAQSQLEKVNSDRAVSSSELMAAQARMRRTREQLKRTELLAPFSAVVTERLLHAGEWADSGEEVVAMTDPHHLEAQGWVPVSVLRFLHPGQILKLQIEEKVYQGQVRTLVPVGDSRSRLYELRVSLPDGRWTVSESLRLAIPTAEEREVLAVPRDALVLRRDAISLFRISLENRAEQIRVTTGIASGPYIEVKGDIQAGDKVVIRGGERLRDGQAVQLLKPDQQP